MSTGTQLIVGGGLAAASAAGTLREEGHTGRIVIVGAEPHLPYERPPLSKGYLTGAATLESAFVHPAEWYDARGIDLVLGTPATSIDLDAHAVTAGAETLPYDKLLLATGSSARRLPPADRSGAAVAYLRTFEDAQRIRALLRPGLRVTVVGGGWIGLEVAASARTVGCEVVVIEPLAEPLLRVLGPRVGRAFATLHRTRGVDIRTSTSVTGIRTRPGSSSSVTGAPLAVVELDDGTATEADLLLVGIGAVPQTDLAKAAGLDVADGVLADQHLRTSHPDVFVAGDIAEALHPRLGQRLRVEHWDNALAQGACAARNMLGKQEEYDRTPYFFSDQYDLGMEYVGHVGPEGYDDVIVRGDPSAGVFTAFWVKGDRALAGMHANDWDATPAIRAIVEAPRVDIPALRDGAVGLDAAVG